MSTLQISAPITADSSAEFQRPGWALRIFRAVIEAVAETNRRRAEREIARIQRYGLKLDRA